MEISNDSGSTHHWIVIYISDLNTFCPHGWQIWLWDNFLKSSMRIQPAGNHLKGSIICWQLNHCKTCKANKLEFQRSTIKSHFKNPTMHQTLHPTMHHVVTEMCTHLHISVTKMVHYGIQDWCIMGFVPQVYCCCKGGIYTILWTHRRHPIAPHTDELWGVYREYLVENGPCSDGTTLYFKNRHDYP